MSKKHSILGLIPLLDLLTQSGFDAEALLQKHGLSLDGMTGAAVLEQSTELAIVADAIELMQDPLLGVKVGSQVTFTSYGTLAMLLMTSDTIFDAARASLQFQSLSLLFSHMSMHVDNDVVEMRYVFPELPLPLKEFTADRDLIGCFVFLKEFIEKLPDITVSAGTARSAPSEQHIKTYQSYLPFPIEFDQPYNWIRLPKTVLSVRNKHGNPLAHKLYRSEAYEMMRKFYPDSSDVVSQIKHIIDGYYANYPSFTELAKMFQTSERTLRRKLVDVNTSYRDILDEHRKNRALSMLAVNDLPVEKLAEQLGYSESASFLRAFKRWTGLTPKQYKLQK